MELLLQYLGSFPISNTSESYVKTRLEKFLPATSQPVELSISILGIKITSPEMCVMTHSMKRVCSFVENAVRHQLAYIAAEPAGRTYRRLCHVFEAHSPCQVYEIEKVLRNAFQTAALTRNVSSIRPPSNSGFSTPNVHNNQPTVSSMSEKRHSSAALLSRILGKKGNSVGEDPLAKRKRRPVSAVFSNAIHRLSTASINTKRMSTIETPRREDRDRDLLSSQNPRIASPVPEEPLPSRETNQRLSYMDNERPGKEELMFDEKLGEWICPVDENLKRQLQQCNYFVKQPTRETLIRNLLSQAEGAFVVRYSESKQRCLALSLRVPFTHNASGISHYLIVRDEKGFRFKSMQKHFSSLQMLITHHSVKQEQLPVTLQFVEWNKSDWETDEQPQQNQPNEEQLVIPTGGKSTNVDENRNGATGGKRVEDFSTPKRHSRICVDMQRKSRLFDM
ncbi:hypothetical protein WR25_16571 [Diploscapter pachys]|uniref:SH2 domain-containing protein n=1 Tax=Diploscapter pachys TaxID=2018661 RepID=A0A2A2LAJ1_9BILA|nr:hypothetical protein WR25_16571 [Diploscapter pachys]